MDKREIKELIECMLTTTAAMCGTYPNKVVGQENNVSPKKKKKVINKSEN